MSEEFKLSYPIVEEVFNEFSEIGRRAVVVELKIRLLANKIPEIQDYAHAKSLNDTEIAILPYLVEKNLITEKEKTHLELSRKIRNKIFHCEFEAAVKFVEELRGQTMPSGAVMGAKVDELEGENILEKILGFANAVQAGKSAKGVFKVDQETTKYAGIFGWLINAHTKGLLTEGQKIASEALAVLDRVFDVLAKQDYEKGKRS